MRIIADEAGKFMVGNEEGYLNIFQVACCIIQIKL